MSMIERIGISEGMPSLKQSVIIAENDKKLPIWLYYGHYFTTMLHLLESIIIIINYSI